jgi:hypothetical protein
MPFHQRPAALIELARILGCGGQGGYPAISGSVTLKVIS